MDLEDLLSSSYRYSSRSAGAAGAIPVLFILAIIGAIVVYFVFLSKKNEGKYKGFLGWLYDFLNFKKLMLESILKILYLICAIFMTVTGIYLLFVSFGAGLSMLVIGNVVLRVTYEFILILIVICKNTSDIRSKLCGTQSKDASFVSEIVLPKKVQDSVDKVVKNVSAPAPVVTENKEVTGEVKYCSKCGAPLHAGDVFCSGCGQKVD